MLAGAAADAATLVISVRTPDGRPLQGAVVTALPLDGSGHKPPPIKAVMDQVNRAFLPDLLVIPVGSTVTFPNSDTVSHQIYSFSPAKRFQLPLYRGTPYPPVHFDQAGVVTLGCNIHDEMVGYLLVTEAPYFGRTDAAGAWTLEVPRGRYRISIW
ncbi:MAG TPA: methylamine utilization protein, partial [Steroidobacteraceae bacterium]|nr:methylamine utilization protein [Steroidobacteraceae bacterium]